ncbi:hypothetical protein P4S63_20070 [Pseudoalteromonas sp. B193]
MLWLAAHKTVCDFAYSEYFSDYPSHISGELDLTTRDAFNKALKAQNLTPTTTYLCRPIRGSTSIN